MNKTLANETRTSSSASSSPRRKRRPGDPWVSRNRVLGSNSATKRNGNKRNPSVYRNPNFDSDETKLLIQLWGNPKVQRELITTHKKHLVIAQLADKMEEYGYHRSPEEITTRIKNMKCFYNRLKKEMEADGMTNVYSTPAWRHFAEMDEVMTRPIFSVRPNEVPAPSLKFLAEQKEETRRERKRKSEEEEDGSDNDIDEEDDLNAIDDDDYVEDDDDDDDVADEEDIDDLLARGTIINKKIDNKSSSNITTTHSTSNADDNAASSDSTPATEEKKDHLPLMETEIKMEIDSEDSKNPTKTTTTTITNDVKMAESSNKTDIETTSTIKTIKCINILEDDDLLVPKSEPIDVDAYDEVKEDSLILSSQPRNETAIAMSQLSNILQQNTKSSTSSTFIKLSMPAANNSQRSTSSPLSNRISVVSPTVLMPPPTSLGTASPSNAMPMTSICGSSVRIGGNIHRIITAGSVGTGGTGAGRGTVVGNSVNNGTTGMKFLLVNTSDPKMAPQIHTASSLQVATNRFHQLPQLLQQTQTIQLQQNVQPQQQQQQQQQQPMQTQQVQQPINISTQLQQHTESAKPISPTTKAKDKTKSLTSDRTEYLKRRELMAIRIMIGKLMKTQEQTNDIQLQRLSVERERCEVERKSSERMLKIFEQQQKHQELLEQQIQQQQLQFQQLLQQQKSQQLQQPFQFTATSTGLMQNLSTISSTTMSHQQHQQQQQQQQQMRMAPKLLITTMLPTSASGTSSIPSSSTIIPASCLTPKLFTSSGSVNNQILTTLPTVKVSNAGSVSSSAVFVSANPASTACQSVNEIQLLKPKEEPMN